MKRKQAPASGGKGSKPKITVKKKDPLRFGEDYDSSTFPVHVYEDERKEHSDGRILAAQDDASAFMQWLIAPCPLSHFTNDIFDRNPLYVSRSALPAYFAGWHSSGDVKALLQKRLKYTTNVDVRKYVDGKVHYMNVNDDNTTDIADPECVWRRFSKEGCTIRILHPQRWCDPLHAMMAACERFWGCATGCNVYLTPPNTQGFPLHYDEIDAFILQLEGSKTWRVYAPKDQEALLPRTPPLTHFEQGQHGEPILEATLTPGDLLYLPRGAPHQALANEEGHSLHVTLSTNQYNTWADFLEIALPQAVELAAKEYPALRQTLPLGFLRYMGVVHQQDEEGDEGDEADSPSNRQRKTFEALAYGMMNFVTSRIPLDSAADQLGKRLMQQRLPPPPIYDPAVGTFTFPTAMAALPSLSSSLSSSSSSLSSKKTKPKKPQNQDRRVRLAYPECARLSVEEDAVIVSHHLKNSRLLHMEGEAALHAESQQLVFELDSAPAIETLLTSNPGTGVLISALPSLEGAEPSLVGDTVRRLLEVGIVEYC